MGTALATAVLVAGALLGAATGVLSGLRPARFIGQFGLSITNTGGANEVRAQYAGFFLAIAALCALATLGLAPRSAALIALIVTFGGLFAGRLVSLVVNGGTAGFPPAIMGLYLIDGAGLALSTAAFLLDGR